MPELPSPAAAAAPPLSPRGPFYVRYPWLPFIAPMAVYMLVPMLFDRSPPGDHLAPVHLEQAKQAYAANYLESVWALVLVMLALPVFLWKSLHMPRFRVSLLAIVVGVVGVVLWVGIDAIGLNDWLRSVLGDDDGKGILITALGLEQRDGFNPIEAYGTGTYEFWSFLILRFIGLALIVPMIEELMLRGWLVRYVDDHEFWRIPFGEVSQKAIAIGIAFPMLYHPEKLPALVWFSLTMWLMVKTKNFWDCVAAHAVTNFMLGVWVVWQRAWHLW